MLYPLSYEGGAPSLEGVGHGKQVGRRTGRPSLGASSESEWFSVGLLACQPLG